METESTSPGRDDRYEQLAAEIRILNQKQDESDNSMKIMFEWFQKQVQTQAIAEEQTKGKKNILAGAIESSSGMKREQIEIKNEQKEEKI